MKTLPNLLITDDNPMELKYLEIVLKKLNVNLIKAESGFDAMEKSKGLELALAIIDVRMPKMNGYEFALKMNEERTGEKVPIIFITASHFSEIKVFKGYSSGAVDYIFKPVNPHILLCKINIFLDLFNQKQTIIRDVALLKKSAADLTRVNATLKKSEKKYRSYIDNAPDGVFVVDETGRYIEVNEATCRITGYSKNELLKMSISDLLSEESLEEGMIEFRKVTKTGTSEADLMFKHKNGTNRLLALNAIKLTEKRFIGFTKDITDSKLVEEEHQTIIKTAMEGFLMLDTHGRFLDVNNAYCHLIGFSREELLNMGIKDVENVEKLKETEQHIQKVIEIGYDRFETQHRCKDGSTVNVEASVNFKPSQGGRFYVFLRDITECKMAEQALKVSEEKYKTMLNASPDGILLIDLKGFITEVSEIGLELLGADNRSELIGKHFLKFIPPEEKNTIHEAIEKTMHEGIAQNIEIKIRKKNQSLFLSEINFTLIQSPGGALFSFMITIRDISQRKKLEKNQIHADRMASLGEMASGIAHEINQPLNTISLVVDNVLFEATKDDNIGNDYLKKKSEKIFENITRIRNIIDHIRAFSRSHDDYILTGFDINSSINKAVSMISEQFKHLAIDLNLQLEENLPLIIGNTFKFEQVILNLLLNAKDTVLERQNKLSSHFDMLVGVRTFQENQCLIIEITDNGTGISEEDIEYITLPFYTTKDTGKGTGLGLPISYQIIKEMNGSIEIMNNTFYGVTFKIILKIQNKE